MNAESKPKRNHHLISGKVQLAIILLVLICVAIGIHLSIDFSLMKETLEQFRETMGWPVLLGSGLLYIILLSIPFFPGLEVGIAIICLFGTQGIAVMYLCTIIGLNLAYLVGAYLPRSMAKNIPELEFKSKTTQLKQNKWLQPFLKKRTETTVSIVVLALLLNLPGNAILGGGGGISMWYGVKHQLPWKNFILTTIVATLPLPLLSLLGWVQLESLF